MNEVTAQHVGQGLFALLKSAVAMFAALAAFFTGLWYAFEPRVEEWLETRIEQALAPHRGIFGNFLEIDSPGIVLRQGPYRAGDTVPIMFMVRRLENCATDVEVRFFNTQTQRVHSSVTYVIPATRAAITSGFEPFTADVQLPEHMSPGIWIYNPRLVPDLNECPGAESRTAISGTFVVVE